MRGTSASGAGHVRPLHVNRGAARFDIGRAYILIMLVISKIIYIMKGMFVLCGRHVGLYAVNFSIFVLAYHRGRYVNCQCGLCALVSFLASSRTFNLHKIFNKSVMTRFSMGGRAPMKVGEGAPKEVEMFEVEM